MIQIEVDYNTVTGDPAERFVIPGRYHSGLNGALARGQRVMLVEPNDYEVEATLEYDPNRDTWYGRPDWQTFHQLSAAPETTLAATMQR
jgi:hypothetical protein